MCRYCKNLKRIKDLDENSYRRIINSWRNRNKKAEDLLGETLDYLDPLWKVYGEMLPDDVLFGVADLTWRIKHLLQQDWTGK